MRIGSNRNGGDDETTRPIFSSSSSLPNFDLYFTPYYTSYLVAQALTPCQGKP